MIDNWSTTAFLRERVNGTIHFRRHTINFRFLWHHFYLFDRLLYFFVLQESYVDAVAVTAMNDWHYYKTAVISNYIGKLSEKVLLAAIWRCPAVFSCGVTMNFINYNVNDLIHFWPTRSFIFKLYARKLILNIACVCHHYYQWRKRSI